MNKILILMLALSSMVLLSCKKGSVTGKVIDPFTGKQVEMVTVWIKQTPFQAKSSDGSFDFQKVKVQEQPYLLAAGKNRWSETEVEVVLTKDQPNVLKNIYIYNRETVTPGMYKANPAGAVKIQNQWLNWETVCKTSLTGYRLKFIDAKSKDVLSLPAPMKIDANLDVLFYNQTAVSSPIVAASYPVVTGPVSAHSDCKGFDAKETQGLFPVLDKGTTLEVAYKSNNLYSISGTLPKGPQALIISQDGKVLKSYYFDVQ